MGELGIQRKRGNDRGTREGGGKEETFEFYRFDKRGSRLLMLCFHRRVGCGAEIIAGADEGSRRR